MDENQVYVTIGGTAVPLQEAINMGIASLQEFAAGATSAGEEAGSGLAAGAERGISALQELRNMMELLKAGASTLGDAFGTLTAHVGGFLSQMWAITGGMMMLQFFNDAIQQVENLAQGFFELNNQMERNVYDWKYMYQSQQASDQLSGWMRGASLNMPFTQTDLMTAISMVAPMDLSAKGVENFMPVLADIAASRTDMQGNPLTLARTAQSVMSAQMGYTRMLKYDLKINPEDLIKYGLDATGTGVGMHINNPQTLLPALEKWAEAQGLTKFSTTQKDANGNPLDVGAAYDIAHNTWWGEQSSWIDRLQNFQRDTGGSMFQAMKQDLDGLNAWWDAHHDQIAQISKVLGTDLALGVKDATLALEGLFQGLKNSSLGQAVMEHLATLADDLASPQTQQNIKQLGQTIGTDLGNGLTGVLGLLGSIKDSLGAVKSGFDDFSKSMSGSGVKLDWWKMLDALVVSLGADIGQVVKLLGDMGKVLGDLSQLSVTLQTGHGNVLSELGALKTDTHQAMADASTLGAVPGSAPGTMPENQLPKAPAGLHWTKGSDGNWHWAPDQQAPAAANVAIAPGGSSVISHATTHATGFGDALTQAHTVATALANTTASNPLKVQIVNGPYNTGAPGGVGSQYQYQYGATQQFNNFFGLLGGQVQQMMATAMRLMQEQAGRAVVTPGSAGAAIATIGGAVGAAFGAFG